MLSNLAALRPLRRQMVSDYSPTRPITNSNMVQDVQVQADSGGEYIDHTSLQMHRRGGCCMQNACVQHESNVIQSSLETHLVITISLRDFGWQLDAQARSSPVAGHCTKEPRKGHCDELRLQDGLLKP